MSFEAIADLRRITTAAPALAALTWDVDPDGYQRVRVPSRPPLEALLRLLLRRGLEPTLVVPLLAVVPARPIERALIAYDVLRSSLLGAADDALAAQLAVELAPLRAIASADAAVPGAQIAALIAAAAAAHDRAHDGSASEDLAALPSLAGLATAGALDDAALEPILAHARLLARAHLSSLAIAFLQIAHARFAHPRALEALVEIALDGDSLASLPPQLAQDDASLRLQTYLLVRASLAQFDVAAGASALAALAQHPGVAAAGADEPRLRLVAAHLAIMEGTQLDYEAARAITDLAAAAADWRYAQAVAFAVESTSAPATTGWRVDSYLSSFGNDAHVWAQAALRDDAHAEVLALLSRELRYGSHELATWLALSVVSDCPAISDDANARVAAQLHDALTCDPTALAFPQYYEPQPLADGRTWTARFESFDLRNDDVYYRLRVVGTDGAATTITGQLASVETDAGATRARYLRDLAEIASAGKAS